MVTAVRGMCVFFEPDMENGRGKGGGGREGGRGVTLLVVVRLGGLGFVLEYFLLYFLFIFIFYLFFVCLRIISVPYLMLFSLFFSLYFSFSLCIFPFFSLLLTTCGDVATVTILFY